MIDNENKQNDVPVTFEDFRMLAMSLAYMADEAGLGVWITVASPGPDGRVDFASSGTALFTNEQTGASAADSAALRDAAMRAVKSALMNGAHLGPKADA